MIELDDVLKLATANVGENYFQLPIAGLEDSIYRERVYCYELYHQMRLQWPKESMYSLCGEIDKRGHPLVRGNGLDQLKPDYLVHVPGIMEENFAVIEVKPVNCLVRGITKDIATLISFVESAGYRRGILLVYGSRLESLSKKVIDELVNSPEEIEIWIHTCSSVSAERVF